MAVQGAAWLALLMPTREARLLGADWNGWLAHWMAAWETVVHSSMWDAYWLTLLSRLAKHDTRGVLSPLLACLRSTPGNAVTLPLETFFFSHGRCTLDTSASCKHAWF